MAHGATGGLWAAKGSLTEVFGPGQPEEVLLGVFGAGACARSTDKYLPKNCFPISLLYAKI